MYNRFFFLLILFIIGQSVLVKAQNKIDSSFKPEKNGYQMVFSDEFNKGLVPNNNDWLHRINQKMGGNSTQENVKVTTLPDGIGCLQINFTNDSTLSLEKQYKGGGVVSTHNFGYGYYEIRVKLYGGNKELSGLHQSFWSMGLTGTNEGEGKGVRDALVNKDLIPQENRVLEIDGFEHNSKDNTLAQNYHIYTPTHLSEAPKNKPIKQDLSKWIVMGYEWLPDRINFYCNRQLFSTKYLADKWKVYAPQNFWLTALPVNLNAWGGLNIPPKDAAMNVDYFRFYAKKNAATNLVGNASFEYGAKGNTYPIAWIVTRTDGNNPDAVKVINDSIGAQEGKHYLEIKQDKNYKATMKQILEFIPDGKYSFSARVKGNVGDKSGVLTIYSGKKSKTIPIKATDKWQQIKLNDIQVANNNATIQISVFGDAGKLLDIDDVVFQ